MIDKTHPMYESTLRADRDIIKCALKYRDKKRMYQHQADIGNPMASWSESIREAEAELADILATIEKNNGESGILAAALVEAFLTE